MKQFILLVSLILLGSLAIRDHYEEQPYLANTLSLTCPEYVPTGHTINANPNFAAPDAGIKGIDQNWYSSAVENIMKEEYNISYSEDIKSYQSPNRANNLRFTYHKDGFTARPRETRIPLFDVNDRTLLEEEKKYEEVEEWSIELRLADNNTDTQGTMNVEDNRAWIECGDVRIDYENTKEGMRQDFIIKSKPEGAGNLEIVMNAVTDLKMNVSKDEVKFSSSSGDKMQYASLKAWDADHRTLDAYFEVRSDREFAIVVDDEDAFYPVTVDPLSSTPDWVRGNWYARTLKFEIVGVGDINLDGYSDVITSSVNELSACSNGHIRAYFGSANGLGTHSWYYCRRSGTGSDYGISVAGSDVNGDGFMDVIVGEPKYINEEFHEGRIHVFYGSVLGLPDSADWAYESNAEYAELGKSIGSAGDFNGDGFGDIIVGAPGYINEWPTPPNTSGRVFIFLGSANGLSNGPVYEFKNTRDAYTGMGESVGFAGDVNADGYSDVVYGEPYWPGPPSLSCDENFWSNGRFSVMFGSPNGPIGGGGFQGEVEYSLFGYSVSAAGDVNGDGFDDVIVGAPNYWNNSVHTGKTYLYYGNANGISLAWSLGDKAAGLGTSVSTAGDLNADGFDDIIIGAHYTPWDNIQDTSGSIAYVFFGSAEGIQPDDWSYGMNNCPYIKVSCAGDVNADGHSDIVIGGRIKNDPNINDYSAIYYGFYGSNNQLYPTADWTSAGENSGRFGFAVSTAGDVNNDGFSDVIIGAPTYSNINNFGGKAYLYHGSASGLSTIYNWSYEDNTEQSLFGESVSSAGDVNGDGYGDVIIGARGYNSNDGRAYVFQGSSNGLSALPSWVRESYTPGTGFGFSVSDAGDVNGDNYSDVIVGVLQMNVQGSHNIGAYVYCGSSSGLSGTESWTASSTLPVSFGRCVSDAGDVNNDGFGDVIVGWNKGLLFYGGQSRGMFQEADWTCPYTATSVSKAGDVNGDGYDDIIIGRYDFGSFEPENAFAFYGSAQGLPSVHNWSVSGIMHFSYVVSACLDFDNDGFDDVIIGKGLTDSDPDAILFRGSPSGLSNNPALSFDVGYCDETSVSDAGDVNGDGFDDILIGNGFYNSANVFYGYGNISVVSYFRITPRAVSSVPNSEICFTALAKDELNRPVPNIWVNFIVRGSNQESQWYMTDNAGTARFCYTGRNSGRDTIIAMIRDVANDTAFAVWDFPAPVELLSFSSAVSGRDISIDWSTSAELNNSGFDIERKSDNKEWSKIGFVAGSGTTNEPKEYSYTDRNLETGKYNYRLKQLDFNGNFEYFELAEVVSIGIPDKYDLSQNYPNPFNPVTTINYDLPNDGIVTIKVYDMLGREVKTLVNEMKTAGYYKIQFSAADLASGAYFYRLVVSPSNHTNAGEFVAVKKCVVLK